MTFQGVCAYYLARGLVFERYYVCDKKKMLFNKNNVRNVLTILKQVVLLMDNADVAEMQKLISEISQSSNSHLKQVFGDVRFDISNVTTDVKYDTDYDEVNKIMLSHIEKAESELQNAFYDARIVSNNLNCISNFPYVYIDGMTDPEVSSLLGRRSRLAVEDAMKYYGPVNSYFSVNIASKRFVEC